MLKKILRILLINLGILSALLIVISIFLPYLFYQFLSAPMYSTLMPEGVRVLNQTSKKKLKPHNYIGIAGDSYAMGSGDWLTRQMGNSDARYYVGHLIHERLGIDLITFGQSGAGSLRGLVGSPITILDYLDKTWLYKIDDPDILLLFFYEGNDLSDNVEYIAAADKCILPFDKSRTYDPEYFDNYAKAIAIHNDSLNLQAEKFSLFDNLFLVTSFKKLFLREKTSFDYYRCSPYAWIGRTIPRSDGSQNHVLVNGVDTIIPDSLQAPSTDLTPDEIRFGLYSFERSLAISMSRFTQSRIGIVYLPSVLSSYEILSTTVSVQPWIHKEQKFAEKTVIGARSNFIAGEIAAIAARNHIPFLDARPEIRAAASRQLIHGPADWNHFNEHGYTALADALTPFIKQLQTSN